MLFAASLNAITRPSRSSTIAGPGSPPISAAINAVFGCVADRSVAVSTSLERIAKSGRPNNICNAPRSRLVQLSRRLPLMAIHQPTSVASRSSSLRIGAVTAGSNSGLLRVPRILSQISRAPRIANAMANGMR